MTVRNCSFELFVTRATKVTSCTNTTTAFRFEIKIFSQKLSVTPFAILLILLKVTLTSHDSE